jgi:uncharacterized DUF497 family protein
MARRAFDDPFAMERDDDREDYDEPRFILLGRVDGRLLAIAFTQKNSRIRIISARGTELAPLKIRWVCGADSIKPKRADWSL